MGPLRDAAQDINPGRGLLRDERAVTAVEYCLIGSGLSLIAVSVFGGSLNALMTTIAKIVGALGK